jgi:hypothetical protein
MGDPIRARPTWEVDVELLGDLSHKETMSESMPPEEKPVLMQRNPNKKVSDEDWAVIRALYCHGELATVLAPRYGIKPQTINSRANKEQWPTPQRIQRAMNNPKEETNDPAQALAALWTQRGEQSREASYQGAKKAMERFWAMSPIPTSFQEAAIAQKLLDKAIDPSEGQQAPTANVSIAVLANQGFVPKQVTVDV